MCDTCGCANDHGEFKVTRPGNENIFLSGSGHDHTDLHSHSEEHGIHTHRIIQVETDILSKNNLLAERNRGFFEARNIKAFNLVSSPGSGKTTILEKLIARLSSSYKIYVIEGDQQTTLDAQRIEASGADSIQVNTGNGCHLDAHMVNHALKDLNPEENSVLFIENVGNLVCPALFDLGEYKRYVITSVTEGEDKPLKYPGIFQSSQLCIMNKIDLLPYLEFDKDLFLSNLQKVRPGLDVIQVSAKTGEGIPELIEYLKNN
jgi:hydrogenase nickel incorporation protein HypB